MINESKLHKQSYMLKRLRDSGYKADKLVGLSDSVSLQTDLKHLVEKVFHPTKFYSGGDVFKYLTKFQTEFLRCMYKPPSYNERDSRVWTIVIDSGGDSVFLTFYKNARSMSENYEDLGNDYFEFYDGGQYIKPLRKRIKTLSFEVISQELNNLGIVKKYNQY